MKELSKELSNSLPESNESEENPLVEEIFEMYKLWKIPYIIPPKQVNTKFDLNRINLTPVRGAGWDLNAVRYTRWEESLNTQSIISSVIVFIMALKLTL